MAMTTINGSGSGAGTVTLQPAPGEEWNITLNLITEADPFYLEDSNGVRCGKCEAGGIPTWTFVLTNSYYLNVLKTENEHSYVYTGFKRVIG